MVEANNKNRIYNLGTGIGFSVREVIDQVKMVTNKDVNVVIGERRQGDCVKLVADPKRC